MQKNYKNNTQMLDSLFENKSKTDYSQETIDVLRLIRSENVGIKTFIELVKLFGSEKEALKQIPEMSIKGGRKKPIKIYSKNAAEEEIDKLFKCGAKIISYKDPNYSKFLLQTPDFPPILSYKGDISLLKEEKIISMVGARNCSLNAKSFASKIAADLISKGYICASGLARGIDTAVHINSLPKTIAVIAGGIDHIYPPENKKLFDQIISEGLLLAELPVGSKPLSQHFPQRNRIIAGLSKATCVIEAGIKSGSLITANLALDYNREVFAAPGFPLDPRCQGSNQLIKRGAHLLENVDDILNNITHFDLLNNSFSEPEMKNNNFNLPAEVIASGISESDREAILELLSSTPISLEEISQESSFSLQTIYVICLELELAGKITRHFGNKISLIY